MTGQETALPALTEPAAAVPCFYRVASRREDTGDTVTVELAEPAGPVPAFAPGQFAMLTALGVGEVPISVSGLGDSGGGRARRLQHTLRAVGAVTRALCAAQPGGLIGVRGPFGTGWDVASAAGRDIVDRGGRDRARATAPRGPHRARRPVPVWPDRAAGRRAHPR